MSKITTSWIGRSLENGRFLVDEKLGEGGMAVVYKGYDLVNNCDVVIKVPKQNALEDKTFLKRFAAENRALINLRHPHIVSILHVGEFEGWPFAVLQYLPGGDLDACRAAFGGKLSILNISKWLPSIAEALDFIHAQGYIHRDVKPANILFDGQGQAFVSDFGIAKVVAEQASKTTNLTATGMVLGTPDYMAPELIMGHPIDGRVDQYALAMTVYECLAGRLPFRAATPAAILVMQTTELAPSLDQFNPAIPHSVCSAVMQGLAKRPDERFSSCATFAQACLRDIDEDRLNSPPASTRSAMQTVAAPQHMIHIDTNHNYSRKRNSVRQDKNRTFAMKVAASVVVMVIVIGILASLQSSPDPKRKEKSNQSHSQQSLKSSEEASVASPALPLSQQFIGRWRIVDDAGMTAFYLTLGESGNAQKSHVPSAVGKWEVVEQEVRVTWSDGWRDILRPSKGMYLKIAFKPGTSWNDSPTNIHQARRESDGRDTPQGRESATNQIEKESLSSSVQAGFASTCDPNPLFQAKNAGDEWSNNALAMVFCWCPPGTFMMGGSPSDPSASPDEKPQREVQLTQGFWLGQTEVTQNQWQSIMQTAPWKGQGFVKEGDNYPATPLSWTEAMAFCAKLTEQEHQAGRLPQNWVYTLPTEAQWEYACRAGTTTKYSFGDDASRLKDYAWFRDNSWNVNERYSHAVGQKQPNPWGLYDMHGNIWEWCRDWYDPSYYRNSPLVDPSGSNQATGRVGRGGRWAYDASFSRSSARGQNPPDYKNDSLGFRAAMVLTE